MKEQAVKHTELKIIRAIVSCNSFAQLEACRDWLERIDWAGKNPEYFEYAFIDQTRKVAKDGLGI